MKAITLVTGFAVSFALSTVTTALAAWMAWPAFGPRGRAALTGLVLLSAIIGITCRWLGRRATGSGAVCKQLGMMTYGELPLTERFDERRHDDLSIALNDFLARVDDMVADVLDRAQEIEAGSVELNSGSMAAVQAAEAQSSTLDTIGGAIDEMTTLLTNNSDAVRSANELTHGVESATRQACEAVQQLLETLQQDEGATEACPRLLAKMADLAFQADVVALNAEVEAARAGEGGRGFAVVAGAMRTLAQDIAECRKHAAELITAMADNSKRGTEIGTSAGEALQTAIADTARSTQLIERLATSTDVQFAGIEKLTAGVTAIGEVTNSSCESARNLAHTAQETVAQVGQLTQAVEARDAD